MRTTFAIALAIAAVCVTAARADWDEEFQITDNSQKNGMSFCNTRKVVIGDGGVVHLVWKDLDAGEVYYKRYWPDDDEWSEDLTLASAADYPGIALDANGTDIHVVWRQTKVVGRGRNKTTVYDI